MKCRRIAMQFWSAHLHDDWGRAGVPLLLSLKGIQPGFHISSACRVLVCNCLTQAASGCSLGSFPVGPMLCESKGFSATNGPWLVCQFTCPPSIVHVAYVHFKQMGTGFVNSGQRTADMFISKNAHMDIVWVC